jgi:hypothetical protein
MKERMNEFDSFLLIKGIKERVQLSDDDGNDFG